MPDKPKKGGAPKKRGYLLRAQRLSLEVETRCDPRTIRRWERGERVLEATRLRLEGAARKLKIPRPEKAS